MNIVWYEHYSWSSFAWNNDECYTVFEFGWNQLSVIQWLNYFYHLSDKIYSISDFFYSLLDIIEFEKSIEIYLILCFILCDVIWKRYWILETLDPKDCREQFLQELEFFHKQRADFQEEMRKKNDDLARREEDLIQKMKRETESLQEYADRLLKMEQVSFLHLNERSVNLFGFELKHNNISFLFSIKNKGDNEKFFQINSCLLFLFS